MSYQAIYDAVRSRISGGDVWSAVESALRTENIGHYAMMAAESIRAAAGEYERPSVIFRPRIYVDGDKWCALYGDDLESGVAGFGEIETICALAEMPGGAVITGALLKAARKEWAK